MVFTTKTETSIKIFSGPKLVVRPSFCSGVTQYAWMCVSTQEWVIDLQGICFKTMPLSPIQQGDDGL